MLTKSRFIPTFRAMASVITHDWVHYVRSASDPKPKTTQLTLFGHNLCPFVERVRLCLAEKSVAYDSVELDLSQRPDWYYEMNPSGKVPTLQFPNGSILYESDLIIELLDQIYANRSVFPEDPIETAKLKLKIRELTSFIPHYYAVVRQKIDWEESLDTLREKFFELERELDEKTFFGGVRLNALDLMVFPHLERILWMKGTHLNSVYQELVGDDFANLRGYYERVRDLSHLKRAFAERRAHLYLIEQLGEKGGWKLRLPLMEA